MEIKNVMLTGATGYLGKLLVKYLLVDGWNVYAHVRDISTAKKNLPNVREMHIFEKIENINVSFDLMIHAATCYGRNKETVVDIYECNVLLPLRLLNIIRKNEIFTFINIDTILNKYTSEYSISKKHFLEILTSFNRQGIRIINIILDQFYGPDDSNSKFTQYILERCLMNDPQINLTDGKQLRNYIYIDDLIEAILVVITNISIISEMDSSNEIYIGAENNISVKEYVKMVHKLTSSTSYLNFGQVPYRENELLESKICLDKIKELGWKPSVDIETGIRLCIEAHQKKMNRN